MIAPLLLTQIHTHCINISVKIIQNSCLHSLQYEDYLKTIFSSGTPFSHISKVIPLGVAYHVRVERKIGGKSFNFSIRML